MTEATMPRHPTTIRLEVERAFADHRLIEYSCWEIEELERKLTEERQEHQATLSLAREARDENERLKRLHTDAFHEAERWKEREAEARACISEVTTRAEAAELRHQSCTQFTEASPDTIEDCKRLSLVGWLREITSGWLWTDEASSRPFVDALIERGKELEQELRHQVGTQRCPRCLEQPSPATCGDPQCASRLVACTKQEER